MQRRTDRVDSTARSARPLTCQRHGERDARLLTHAARDVAFAGQIFRHQYVTRIEHALAAVSEQMIAAIPDLVEQAVADIRQQKDAGFNFSYEREKTALENYQEHRYIALTVSHWLEARFPERFAEVRKQFDAKLEAIDRSLRGVVSLQRQPFQHVLSC